MGVAALLWSCGAHVLAVDCCCTFLMNFSVCCLLAQQAVGATAAFIARCACIVLWECYEVCGVIIGCCRGFFGMFALCIYCFLMLA